MSSFKAEFYLQNRRRLSDALPQHLLVIPAHAMPQYSADTTYPFRQDSNFLYLTGCYEPDVVLVIDTNTNHSTLFIPERNDYQQKWDGAIDTELLKIKTAVDDVKERNQLASLVREALADGKTIGYIKAPPTRIEPYGFFANPARKLIESELSDICPEDNLQDIRIVIARLRQVKQPEEIEAITTAIDVTAQALEQIKANLSAYKNEQEVERALSSYFYGHSDGHSFNPIVASGKNAATVHYTLNNSRISTKDLLLLDVGAQHEGYAADISRTWSLQKPSKRQQELWESTLRIQEEGLRLLGPGVLLRDVQKKLETYAQKEFKRLKCSMAGQPFPHGFPHYMGLDVHDSGDYDMPLQENTVITLEPGMYLPDESIGTRVEDDVLITSNGVKNLSAHIPKVLY